MAVLTKVLTQDTKQIDGKSKQSNSYKSIIIFDDYKKKKKKNLLKN